MSTPAADTTPPPAAPADAGKDNPGSQLDPSLKILFDTVDSEVTSPEKSDRGLSLEQAIQPDDEPAAKPEAKTDEAAKPEVTPPPAKPVEEDRPIKGRKKPAPEPAVAPAPTPDPVPERKPDPTDELAGIELMDEEKESLALAKFAESKGDPKYAGLVAKTTKYIKDHAKFVEEERKADPDAVFDATNPRYQAWLSKNKPVLSMSEARSIERERIADEAKRGLTPEIERMKDELYRRDAEPEVRREGDGFVQSIVNEGVPESLAKSIKDEGLAKAKEKFPFEFSVVEEVLGKATSDIEEFIRLTKKNPETGRTLATYDDKNPQHKRVVDFVESLCVNFKKGGGAATVVDGKRFLTRTEFYSLKPEQRAPYWTFDNKEVVNRAKMIVKHVIKTRIDAEEQRLEKMGFKRQKVETVPAATQPPPPSSPPAPRGGTVSVGEVKDVEDPAMKKIKNLLLGD